MGTGAAGGGGGAGVRWWLPAREDAGADLAQSLGCSEGSVNPSRLCPRVLAPSVSPAPDAFWGGGASIAPSSPSWDGAPVPVGPTAPHGAAWALLQPSAGWFPPLTLQNGFACVPLLALPPSEGSRCFQGATSSHLRPRGAGHEDAVVAGRDLGAGNTLVTAKASPSRLVVCSPGGTDRPREGGRDGQPAAQGVSGATHRVWGEQQIATVTSHLPAACFWERADFSRL